jgi:uncharacterized protein
MLLSPAELADWEERFQAFLPTHADVAHDLEHTRRVVQNARRLAAAEGADLMIVLPAAWLHDCVVVPKDSPQRSLASQMAAQSAGAWLHAAGYPAALIPPIQHAIAAHSFSAGIAPQTREAHVVQDADRLDFYTKLLHLAATMQTPTGRAEAAQRTHFLQQFLDQLAHELWHPQ